MPQSHNKDFFKQPIRIEQEYFKSLKKFKSIITSLLNKTQSVQGFLDNLDTLFHSEAWAEYSDKIAERMVEKVQVHNAKSWREAAKGSSKSYRIYQGLKKDTENNKAFESIIEENSKLIKGMPKDLSLKISKLATSQAVEGKRADDLMETIRKYAPGISENRAKLIARTETAKAQAAITQMRAQRIGLQFYQWQTAQDQRVRSSHKHMQGVVCRYDKPPDPEAIIGVKSNLGSYNAGSAPNCRCYAAPLLDADEAMALPSPVKYAIGSKLVSLSKKDFMKEF